MKKLLSILLCCTILLGFFPGAAYAEAEWPTGPDLQSQSGIVMDADTKTVLWGQNIHDPQFPASITKVLTALVVLENVELDEIVTFSQNAVYNVEQDSSSAGLDTGDQLSVKDCLYAMLLKSANEAANALAEHVAGTTENFAIMMNEKASELGCTESNFKNPSGLNDPEHYVTAYDMALITSAAFENDIFCDIVGTTYYELPPSLRSPEGQGISPGNEMIKKNSSNYRKEVIGGKTGYTSLAGNTLVICAKKGDMKVVTVVMNSNFKHYEDTKLLLDFAFDHFQSLKVADYDNTYSAKENDLLISGLSTSKVSNIAIDKESRITLPKDAIFSDAISQINYDLNYNHPENALAQINYTYQERPVGHAFLVLSSVTPNIKMAQTSELIPTTENSFDIPNNSLSETITSTDFETSEASQSVTGPSEIPTGTAKSTGSGKPNFQIPSIVWKILGIVTVLAVLAGGGIALFHYRRKREEAERMLRRQKRMQRLQESGFSVTEFDALVERKRSSYTTKRKRRLFFKNRRKK